MKQKYTKVNHLPYIKIRKANKVNNINNVQITKRVYTNMDIADLDMEELAYIMNYDKTENQKIEAINLDHIENINSVPLSNIENLEKEDLSDLIFEQEITDVTEKKEFNLIENLDKESQENIGNLAENMVQEPISEINTSSEVKDLSTSIIEDETTVDIKEVEESNHMDNLKDSISIIEDSGTPDIEESNIKYNLEEIIIESNKPDVEDIFSENMAQESNNNICNTLNAMSYENSISPPENIPMRGVNLIMAQCTNPTGVTGNCAECCQIFTNDALRPVFGYTLETAVCRCHDICVEDVRDICVEQREFREIVPCNVDGFGGCRGGFSANGVPTVDSFRVDCAQECLFPPACDRIINQVNFQVILDYNGTKAIMTFADEFECFWYEFARFPSGEFYANTPEGLAEFREELALIDGSCKVIVFDRVEVVAVNGNCELQIDYTVVDKLWKHENILVTGLTPYEEGTITVKQEFAQGHAIEPCSVCNNG